MSTFQKDVEKYWLWNNIMQILDRFYDENKKIINSNAMSLLLESSAYGVTNMSVNVKSKFWFVSVLQKFQTLYQKFLFK